MKQLGFGVSKECGHLVESHFSPWRLYPSLRYARAAGFTLIEILITVGIVAIIAAVAVGVYTPFALKGRRSDAINALLSISMAEERYRATNTLYGNLSQVWGGISTSPQGYYTLSISNLSATSYTITAQAIGNQANDTEGSTSCSTMQLSLSSGTITHTPADCWPS